MCLNNYKMSDEGKVSIQAVIPPSIQTPAEFDFDRPERWGTWSQRFLRYVTISNLSNRSEKEKIDVLLYTMGAKSEDILKQIMPDMPDTTTLDVLIKKFKDYFEPKKNVVFERFKFNSRVQQPGETADTFITSLYSLADSCEYGDIKEELIRDRIVIGISDARTSERLQMISDLKIEKAVEIVRQAEIQSKEGKNLRRDILADNHESINKMGFKSKNKASDNNINKNFNQSRNDSREYQEACGRCGFKKHYNSQKCPAANSKCRKCNKVGHWDRMCRGENSRSRQQVRLVEEPNDEERERENEGAFQHLFLHAVQRHESSNKDFMFSPYITEFEREISFIIDTGADISCISEKCIPISYRNKIVKVTDKMVYGPDDKELSLIGFLNLNLKYKNFTAIAKIYVFRNFKNNLLGKPEIKKFNLISRVNKIEVDSCSSNITPFFQYPELFEGIGTFKQELKIQIKDNITPFFQSTPRTVPIPLLSKLKNNLDALVKQGLLITVDFPTDWCSPIVVTPKKESNDIRICGDFTKLNKAIKRSHYPVK